MSECKWKRGGCNGTGLPCSRAVAPRPESEDCVCGHHLNCCGPFDAQNEAWDFDGADGPQVEAGRVLKGEAPCLHAARHGYHEWYIETEGGCICRACGAIQLPAAEQEAP